MASKYGDDAEVGGSLSVTGAFIHNEDSGDVDFRVESNGQTHMLYVDASTDRVGVGTDSPSTTLHAYADVSDAYVTLIDNDAGSNAHGLKVTSDGTGTGTILLDVEAASTTVFKIRGDGRVGIGVATPGSTLSVDDEIAVGEKLIHRGDPDTYLQFPGQNQVNLVANGHSFLKYDGDIKINNANRDRDTQIMADNGDVVLHVDAGDNRVGIGTSSPGCKFDVAGSFRTGLVTLTATGTVTAATHAGRTLLLGEVGGNATCTITLPAATGTGDIYRFIVSVVNTSNYVINVADATDTIAGSVNILDADSTAQTAYAATGADDTITLNGTTTGGALGDWLEFVDIATNQWAVRGQLVVPAGSNIADPFSATVS
jgi:hypothetical protein